MGTVRLGMVGGGGVMGHVHSLALGALGGLPHGTVPRIELTRFADQSPAVAEGTAAAWGRRRCGTAWRAVSDDAEFDLVLVRTPDGSHAEIAVATLQSGKHVLREKPPSNRVGRAPAMYHAARGSGRAHQVGFVCRKWPAAQFAQEIVAAGEIGAVVHQRGRYFHDYALDPEMPFSWRLDGRISGGAAGADIGGHVIDLGRFLRGREIVRLCATQRTQFRDRPLEVDEISDMLVELDAGVRDALGEIGYSVVGNIEQDIDPSRAADPLADAIDSRRFLERCGIATPGR